jgi:SAM-dependent methyltransferase
MNVPVFSASSKFYDLLYRDKKYKEEVEYVLQILREYSPQATTILELGSGTGVHARLFAEQGFQVHGIERSAEMLTVANEQSVPKVTFQQDDIAAFGLDKKFDVTVALFHVISYVKENTALISVLKNVAEHLEDGGLFIFDVWHSPAVYVQRPEKRTKKVRDEDLTIVRTAEPTMLYDKNLVQVNYKFQVEENADSNTDTSFEKHTLRHFSQQEIALLAHICNFEVLRTEEFLTGKDLDETTWGACYILRKGAQA